MRFVGRWRQFHYAWVILASAMLIHAVSSGLRLSFGVVIDPLVEQYGWSRSAISFAYTLEFLTAIPVYLIVSKLEEKVGSRYIILASVVLFFIGMLLVSTVNQVWQFQLYWGVLTAGLGTAAFRTLLPVILTRWFERKLGIAIGLLWTALGWGPAAYSPLLRWAISTLGWHDAFIILGLASGALMLVFSLFIRNYPEEMKLTRYGMSAPESVSVKPDYTVKTFGLRQLMVMGSFWGLTAIHGLGCIGHSIPLAHMVSMATFSGVSDIAAAGMLSITLATSLISRFTVSLLSEAKGARFTLTLVLFLQTLPILMLLSARELPWLYSFAFLFGLGYGGEMVGFPIFNRQYYGINAPLSAIFAYQMVGASLGMAAGGWLGGALFDWTGSYTWSVMAALLTSFAGGVVAMLLPARRRQ